MSPNTCYPCPRSIHSAREGSCSGNTKLTDWKRHYRGHGAPQNRHPMKCRVCDLMFLCLLPSVSAPVSGSVSFGFTRQSAHVGRTMYVGLVTRSSHAGLFNTDTDADPSRQQRLNRS